MPMNEPKILVYDIETTPVLAWIWRCGDQVVRHHQLYKKCNETKVICITYQWLHEKKPQALVAKIGRGVNDKQIMKQFRKLAMEADVVIGKNNTRFDDKHINYRLFALGLDPIPDLARKSDDVERWMRRQFNMQSYALDHITELQTGTGKIKMEFNDWIAIVQDGDEKALKKMVKYGLKDTADTVRLINKVMPHAKPKYNMATHFGDLTCTNCGSLNIKRNGTRIAGSTKRQHFYCNDHGGHAGYAIIKKDGSYGKMGS